MSSWPRAIDHGHIGHKATPRTLGQDPRRGFMSNMARKLIPGRCLILPCPSHALVPRSSGMCHARTPRLAFRAPASSGGTGLWVGTLQAIHWRSCGAHSQTTRRIPLPQPNRKPDRAQPTPLWSLPDLVVVSISELLCRPCALHEGRIRVGALCRWSWVYGCWCLGLADLGPLVGARSCESLRLRLVV